MSSLLTLLTLPFSFWRSTFAGASAGAQRKELLSRHRDRCNSGPACLALMAASLAPENFETAARPAANEPLFGGAATIQRMAGEPAGGGLSLAQMVRQAARMGLACRPLRIGFDVLRKTQVPLVLQWRHQYVVLRKVRGNWVEIHDPLHGRISLTIEEAARQYGGIALLFERRGPESAQK